MKVMQRGVMKVVPSKMAEAMELNEKYMAIVGRLGMPLTAMRMYRPFIGGPEYMHTIVFEVEWDDFATMAAFFEKVMTEPEVQAMMPKWDAVLKSHEVELYVPMP
jgi:hypothetical protein